MKKHLENPLYIIGISVRTSNLDGKASHDIPALWNRFMQRNIMNSIPNKVNHHIYCLYTEYEGDYTLPYTCVLGCSVENLDNIPEGFQGFTIPAGNYQQFSAKGNLMGGAVYEAWLDIWNTALDRNYHTDYEVYDERASNPKDGEADIFIGINQ